MRKRGRKPRIIVVSCPFFCYFIVQVQNVSSPLHNLICGLVHISDSFLPGLRELTDAIHEKGGKCCAQIHHAGIQTSSKTCGCTPWAVSAVPSVKYREPVHEMTNHEIYELIEKFIDAGERVKKAGFDLVEVHGAHGYLIAQFLSKATNKRCDEFGGSYENRFRFAGEVIRGIKKRCGEEFPVQIRMSAEEFMEGGCHIEDTEVYAGLAEEAGADAIHLSTGTASGGNIVTPYYTDPGFNLENAARIKKCVKIPVIGVGRINDPALAWEAVASGKADLISLGRQLSATANFPIRYGKAGRRRSFTVRAVCRDAITPQAVTSWTKGSPA